MRFSKQERIAALIILAVIILALGAFLIIKPAFEDFSAAKKTLTSKEQELKGYEDRAAMKKPLREQIEKAYEDGEHAADMFFPELASYEADDAFRAFISQCSTNIIVEQVSVSEPTTAVLSNAFFTPASVEYALKTYVQSGIEPTEEELKVQARTEALMAALSEPQTIGASKVDFTVTAKSRDDILKFADEVNDYMVNEGAGKTRKAIMITGMQFTYDEVNQKYSELVEKEIAKMDAEGERALAAEVGADIPQIPVIEEEPEENDGKPVLSEYLFTYSGTLTFYSIERMQNPKAQLDAQDGVGA